MRRAQEFRGGGRGAGGREGGGRWGERAWVGTDRLKLYQGYDFVEKVPLQKGAPKREFWRDLESTKGFILETDLKAGSGGWGRKSSRHTKDTRPRRQDRFFTKVNCMLFCQWFP